MNLFSNVRHDDAVIRRRKAQVPSLPKKPALSPAGIPKRWSSVAIRFLPRGSDGSTSPPIWLKQARSYGRCAGRPIGSQRRCVAQGGEPLWRAISTPELRMREFSEAFLEGYIAAEGEALLGTVGAYRLEGRGVQLFSRIKGDHFAVFGLPLIELLGFFRERGVMAG
jgi:hypothetical protein